MRVKILEWLSWLPIWKTYITKSRKKEEPNKGKMIVVLVKEVWLFGWTRLVLDVRLEDEVTERV